VAGYVRLTLTVGKQRLRIHFDGLSKSLTVAVPAHTTRTLNIPVCSNGPTSFSFTGTATGALDDRRRTSAHSTPAEFVADASACSR
jgi:hypothetical protein